MECQRGVIGDLAGFPAVAQAARDADLAGRVVNLVSAVRATGALVVHATAMVRPGRVGTPSNAPLLRAAERSEVQLIEGSPPAELVPGLFAEGDLVSARLTGVSPFGPTDLAAVLAEHGIDTIVAVGASLNVGIAGLCIGAVDHGFEVVVVIDATIAVPGALRTTLLDSSIAPLARLATSAEVIAALIG